MQDQQEELTLVEKVNNCGLSYCSAPHAKAQGVQQELLLQILQTNDCRSIIANVVDKDVLANAFVHAAGCNHVTVLEEFCNAGVNIDVKDNYSDTALINASFKGEHEAVSFLLDHNANPDGQSDNGNTALHCAALVKGIQIASLLLKKNANPDIQNTSSNTALIFACRDGQEELVRLLLNHGVDIELRNNNGKSALDLARTEEIKKLLSEYVPSNNYLLK